MRKLLARFARWLTTGIIVQPPSGLTPDTAAMYGYFALQANLNLYVINQSNVTTVTTTTPITAAALLSGFVRLLTGAGGAFAIQLPTTAAILSGMPSTVPTNGTFAMIVSFQNDGVGQTGTVTVGDASTTLTGTATIATNTRRQYLLTVTGPGTITLQNMGTVAL